jgi:AcrR family transcriptional regulator
MSAPTSTSGQPLGERGIRTRQRILEVVASAIEKDGLRGLRVADVAAEVGLAPPSFYQYFNDLDEAILALCQDIGDLLPKLEFDGLSEDHLGEGSRSFITRFFEYWAKYRAVLSARNIAVTSGDERFVSVRDEAYAPLREGLTARIEAGQRDGQIDPSISAFDLGLGLTVMLERTAMIVTEANKHSGRRHPAETETTVIALAYAFDSILGVEPGKRSLRRGTSHAASDGTTDPSAQPGVGPSWQKETKHIGFSPDHQWDRPDNERTQH